MMRLAGVCSLIHQTLATFKTATLSRISETGAAAAGIAGSDDETRWSLQADSPNISYAQDGDAI